MAVDVCALRLLKLISRLFRNPSNNNSSTEEMNRDWRPASCRWHQRSPAVAPVAEFSSLLPIPQWQYTAMTIHCGLVRGMWLKRDKQIKSQQYKNLLYQIPYYKNGIKQWQCNVEVALKPCNHIKEDDLFWLPRHLRRGGSVGIIVIARTWDLLLNARFDTSKPCCSILATTFCIEKNGIKQRSIGRSIDRCPWHALWRVMFSKEFKLKVNFDLTAAMIETDLLPVFFYGVRSVWNISSFLYCPVHQ